MFNPETFASTTVTESNDTKVVPVPEGEYVAVIDKAEAKVTGNGSAMIEVHWKLDLPESDPFHGRGVRQTVWLDVTEQGNLDMGKGKNIGLGRLREAVNQNTAGQPWSPNMLQGNVAKISVKHRQQDEDTFADVKGVAKLS